MSDIASNELSLTAAKHVLTDEYTVQRASEADLSEILVIYNQTIAGKQATANLTPVTCDERAEWFNEHLHHSARPIYVVRAVNKAIESSAKMASSPIVAWGSFSDLYARPAYHISTEISIYLHKDYHGRGMGSSLTCWMMTQAPSLGIHNVVALIFAHNQPSLGLFRKLGFEQWGLMPQVCDMEGFIADVVMLGKSLVGNDSNNHNNDGDSGNNNNHS